MRTDDDSGTVEPTTHHETGFEPSPPDAPMSSTLSCAKAWRMDDEALRDIFTRIVGRMVLDNGDTVMRAVMPFLAERRDCRSMTRAEMLSVVKQHEERFNPPALRASGARAVDPRFALLGTAQYG